MKFVQNNLVFILFSGVFGLLFLTLFGLSWFLSGSGEETKAKIDEIRTEIENLHYEKLPYVSLEHDLKLATADLDKLASDERTQNRLWKTVLALKRTLPSIGTQIRGSHQFDPHPSVRPTYQLCMTKASSGSRTGFRFSFRRTTCGGTNDFGLA